MKMREIRIICEVNNRECGNDNYRQIYQVDGDFIGTVAHEILNLNRGHNILQNIDDILDSANNGKNNSSATPWFNTYPFGHSTDKIYPRFLAICRGEDKLSKTFDKISKQSRKIADTYKYDCNTEKTVILLTDKWNMKAFKKYEKEFLNYALRNGIWYVFLWITEYGYTQIPFLPNDRRLLQGVRVEKVEDDVTLEEMIDRLQCQSIAYDVTGGTWRQSDWVRYCFFADCLTWFRETISDNRKGTIPEKPLRKFLEDALWISETAPNEVLSNISAKDAPISTLHIFGRTITWDVPDNCEKRIIALQNSIGKFIKACEKTRR